MTKPATPSSQPSASNRNAVVVDENAGSSSFDYRLHQFWKNNGKLVLGACVVVLLAILVRGGWEVYEAQQERGIESDYAAAVTPEKLKAFAAAHAGHSLAGVAYLRMADDDYSAGKYADAIAEYEKASAILKTGPLAARARLGSAMAMVGSGKTAEGEAVLRQLSSDTAQLNAIRAEASYHLASLAAEAGRNEDVGKYADLDMQIDGNSIWAQRAMALRATLPAPTAPALSTPAVVTPDAKNSGPQVKLPGKD